LALPGRSNLEDRRIDVPALGLVPLRLDGQMSCQMAQVLPGTADDPDYDPIIEASKLNQAGDQQAAHRLLLKLLAVDLRCLDAYVHLGIFAFDHPDEAITMRPVTDRAAVCAGRGSTGCCRGGGIDNRPFLRCLPGCGLCVWRLGKFNRAAEVFERMLRFNPADNQSARGLLPAVRAGEPWQADG
jgi:tetratricopeptide (TPR) repeat protein